VKVTSSTAATFESSSSAKLMESSENDEAARNWNFRHLMMALQLMMKCCESFTQQCFTTQLLQSFASFFFFFFFHQY
jgi:hypothetical protein